MENHKCATDSRVMRMNAKVKTCMLLAVMLVVIPKANAGGTQTIEHDTGKIVQMMERSKIVNSSREQIIRLQYPEEEERVPKINFGLVLVAAMMLLFLVAGIEEIRERRRKPVEVS